MAYHFTEEGKQYGNLNALSKAVAYVEKGGDYKLETGHLESYEESIIDQISKDKLLSTLTEEPFKSAHLDSCVPSFFRYVGKKPRDYQRSAAAFCLALLTEIDIKAATLKMGVGIGKNFIQSFLAHSLVEFNKDNRVLILHDQSNVCEHSYRTYGITNPAAARFGQDFSQDSKKIIYADCSDWAAIFRYVTTHKRRLTILMDECDRALSKFVFGAELKLKGKEVVRMLSTAATLLSA